MELLLRPYYRHYQLPWSDDPEAERRFRKLWSSLLIATILMGIVVWLIRIPEPPADLKPSIPPVLAKIVIEREIIPPPPPPPPPELDLPKPEPKPAEVKPRPRERVPVEEDLARTQRARKNAQSAGLLAMQDQLADIRQQFELTKDQLTPSANMKGEVEGPSRAERSLITSKVGQSSGGITTAGASRGFGGGAGNLGGVGATQMVVPFGGSGSGSATSGSGKDGVKRTGSSGKASRSREEIETVFDRNKGALYALYTRAQRENPELQGKLVLEITISPAGDVTNVKVVSSELKDPELERKIAARVRLFRFEAKDVETITASKPIDFFPA
jgi:periplasmic protein TonB